MTKRKTPKDKTPNKKNYIDKLGRVNNNVFKKGNDNYKLRVNVGREKQYTPTELASAANEYFYYCDTNPINESAIHQRSGDIIQIPRPRAYTLQGLCNYLDINAQTLYNYESLKDNDKGDEARAYFDIVTRIRQICYAQKLEGAAAGVFNPSIIARELGLTDKTETIESGTAKRLQIEIVSTTAQSAALPTDKSNTIEIQPTAETKTIGAAAEPQSATDKAL